MPTDDVLLEMQNITKDFPGVRALDDVSFQLRKGEVHALVGENGAGKSTLMLILGGVHRDYQGQISLDGQMIRLSSPSEAITQGIGIIYQELDLVPALSAGENVFLGYEPTGGKLGLKFLSRGRVFAETKQLLDDLGFTHLSPEAKVESLSVGDQQLVQIAKAIKLSARVLVMDEPTARLAYHETEGLFENITALKERGMSIIYISHHMEEILRVADRVTVLRDGRVIGTVDKEDMSLPDIIRMVVGKELASGITRPEIPKGNEVLSVKGLGRAGVFEDVTLSVREGEILGVGGLVGSGRTELVRCIYGADQATSGEIHVRGAKAHIPSPQAAIDMGIVLVPEDRKSQGLILIQSVRQNLSLAVLRLISKFQFINMRKREKISADMVNALDIKTPSLEVETQTLSGGNQQKVVMGRWLAVEPRIFILDQPTRGIDVGAKREMYRLMVELAKGGSAVVLVTDELPELIGLADRIVVMRNGRMTNEFARGEVTEEQLLAAVLGHVA
jgi:ribose transport system ATP-binding protein